MRTIITDDGREYTDIEIGDVVPAPTEHTHNGIVGECWVCRWRASA